MGVPIRSSKPLHCEASLFGGEVSKHPRLLLAAGRNSRAPCIVSRSAFELIAVVVVSDVVGAFMRAGWLAVLASNHGCVRKCCRRRAACRQVQSLARPTHNYMVSAAKRLRPYLWGMYRSGAIVKRKHPFASLIVVIIGSSAGYVSQWHPAAQIRLASVGRSGAIALRPTVVSPHLLAQ